MKPVYHSIASLLTVALFLISCGETPIKPNSKPLNKLAKPEKEKVIGEKDNQGKGDKGNEVPSEGEGEKKQGSLDGTSTAPKEKTPQVEKQEQNNNNGEEETHQEGKPKKEDQTTEIEKEKQQTEGAVGEGQPQKEPPTEENDKGEKKNQSQGSEKESQEKEKKNNAAIDPTLLQGLFGQSFAITHIKFSGLSSETSTGIKESVTKEIELKGGDAKEKLKATVEELLKGDNWVEEQGIYDFLGFSFLSKKFTLKDIKSKESDGEGKVIFVDTSDSKTIKLHGYSNSYMTGINKDGGEIVLPFKGKETVNFRFTLVK